MQFLSLVDHARRAGAASVDRIFQHSDFAPAINHFSSPRQNNSQFFPRHGSPPEIIARRKTQLGRRGTSTRRRSVNTCSPF
jgi:hypothetical protein